MHDHGAQVSRVELEGEVLVGFVTDAAAWIAEVRGPAASPVRRILDVGSGPGVGTCELAARFPEAEVVAVDSSPEMLERAAERAKEQGVAARVRTHLAELPDGLDEVEPADVIWASMSLHHVGDEVGALRGLRGVLDPQGVLAISERHGPVRALPGDLDLGDPAFVDRLDEAAASWFAAMRDDLPGSVASIELPAMVAAAGFDVVVDRVAEQRFDPPLPDKARRVVLGQFSGMRDRLQPYLPAADLQALDILADPEDPRGVARRADLFLDVSRRVVIARPSAHDDDGSRL
jgi:SAM-dependent methyltransferase